MTKTIAVVVLGLSSASCNKHPWPPESLEDVMSYPDVADAMNATFDLGSGCTWGGPERSSDYDFSGIYSYEDCVFTAVSDGVGLGSSCGGEVTLLDTGENVYQSNQGSFTVGAGGGWKTSRIVTDTNGDEQNSVTLWLYNDVTGPDGCTAQVASLLSVHGFEEETFSENTTPVRGCALAIKVGKSNCQTISDWRQSDFYLVNALAP